MQLSAVVRGLEGVSPRRAGPHADPDISAVVLDSRAVAPGALFCCLRGSTVDGHDHAAEAVERGAVALVVDHELSLEVPQLVVDDVRIAVGPLAASLHDNPSHRVAVIGVTGTNGKTTVTHMLRAIYDAAGARCDVIGTLSALGRGAPPTTPDAPDLQALLSRSAATADVVAMEVSSHALAQGRVRGTRFAAAVFTNLSRDHLDYHGTEEEYFAAKASLFTPEYAERGVVNVDDARGRALARASAIPIVTFDLGDAVDLAVDRGRSTFTWRGMRVTLPLGGRFNVSNALAAATCAAELGVSESAIAEGLRSLPPIPGRWEAVDVGQAFTVVVDYAHTPDALAGALATAREQAGAGRVIVVFGAGGDKDRGKRPDMGAAAAGGADEVILTSDNPRSEDPRAIISDVLRGIPDPSTVVIEPDRRAALALGLARARPGDIVVVAGKGHEDYQEIAGVRHAFDDRVVVRELLEGST